MTWWLSCSAAELNAARTCRNCGCKDADIDIGLCFECFCEEQRSSECSCWGAAVTPTGAKQQRQEEKETETWN